MDFKKGDVFAVTELFEFVKVFYAQIHVIHFCKYVNYKFSQMEALESLR